MQILSVSDPNAASIACEALSRGELVIYPTETCYGIAADTSNPKAITKLLNYKGDRHRQISIAVDSVDMAKKYVSLNAISQNLYTNFLPGPMTVISQSKHLVDERLESVNGTLGVRFPKHDFAQELINKFGKPLTATSANTSGKKEPYSLGDYQKYTSGARQDMVALFLDAGQLADRPTSTVVDTTLNSPEILRQGELMLPDSSPVFISHSEEETRDFAANLVKKYLNLTIKYPLIFALQGDLGVGKTRIGQGVAQALEIKENVASPTYTLLHEYPYSLPKYSGTFYHLDTWRLSDLTELESTLHLSSLLKPGNILVMEWAGKAKELIENYKNLYPIILINIKEKGQYTRLITYSFSTPEWS